MVRAPAKLPIIFPSQLPRLLSSVSSDEIHKGRRQCIVCLQPHRLELAADLAHTVRVEALLDDRGNEGSKLRLLPALLVGQLDVNEVETLKWMVDLDATEQVHSTLLASVSLDGGALVDDLELFWVSSHSDLLLRNDSDNREERSFGFPALRASACVVVSDISTQSHFDFVTGAVAVQLSTAEVGITLGDAVVDKRVEVKGHFGTCIALCFLDDDWALDCIACSQGRQRLILELFVKDLGSHGETVYICPARAHLGLSSRHV